MTNPANINTILLIPMGPSSDYWNRQIELRVGYTAPMVGTDTAVNDVCWPASNLGTGWYQCGTTLSGTHVTVRRPIYVPTWSLYDYLYLHEVIAYTEYAVQHNAISVITSSIDPMSSSSFVLRMSSIDATWGGTGSCTFTDSELEPKLSIRLKAQTFFPKIVLVPPLYHG